MKMKGFKMTDSDLDDLFAAARDAGPMPGDALSARVLADADAVMATRLVAPVVRVIGPDIGPGFWASLAGIFGGSGAVAGMLTATVAGFYIGFAQPMDGFAVSALAGVAVNGGAVDLEMMPGLDALLEDTP